MKAISQTLKVTKAYNLISTSKLRQGKAVLANAEPYFLRIQRTMADILSNATGVRSLYFEHDSEAPACIIAVTSDKGLAGGYNANVYHYVMNLVEKEAVKPVIVLVGQVGMRYFGACPYSVIENFSFTSQMPCMEDAKTIADFVLSQYEWGQFSSIRVVYTHMVNVVKQVVVDRLVAPFDRNVIHRSHPEKDSAEHFEYLPSAEEVFNALAPQYAAGIIHGALIEAYTSEQSQRMNAMDQASRNAEDMLSRQQLFYNRARQAQITQEITEIVGGSSALEN
jgi:F-type H+-transporting ATPase subunit gamma